jgi:hypothetical protein
VQIQGITNVIEADGVSQLGEEQTNDVAPRKERAGLFVHPGFPRQSRNQMGGNPFAKLGENRDFRTAWLSFGFVFFHPCRVAGKTTSAKLFLFGYGMPVISYQ